MVGLSDMKKSFQNNEDYIRSNQSHLLSKYKMIDQDIGKTE